MSESNNSEQRLSGVIPLRDIQQKFKQHIEELLSAEKAHLPKMPAPPKPRLPRKPKAIRELETQVEQLLEERALPHLRKLKETVKKKVTGAMLELQTRTDYYTNVAEWLEHKQKMLSEADETSIYRWDTKGKYKIYYLTRPNAGKQITDNNPYVNFVDIEEFDLATEIYPTFEHPPVWDYSEYAILFFTPVFKEAFGQADVFISQIQADNERMWEEGQGKRIPPVAAEKEPDLHKLKEEIREYAKTLDFPCMGVTKLDRRHTAAKVDDELAYDTLIVLGHEMPLSNVLKIPGPSFAAFTSYRDGGHNVHKVADFIRSKGYRCLARTSADGGIKYVPHAINAGMGNYSTQGICITPEVGTRPRFVGITIDAELPLDEPRDYNIEEFCARCRSCQKVCPADAIPKDEKRFRGTLKRQTNHTRCWEYMAIQYECGLCVRICPFSILGYEQCMRALPQYYMYNLHRNEIDAELLRSSWKLEESTNG